MYKNLLVLDIRFLRYSSLRTNRQTNRHDDHNTLHLYRERSSLICHYTANHFQFISYTECSTDVFSAHGVRYHLFADDTQCYDSCPVTSTCIQSMLTRLSSCINDLAALFSSLRLQLNPTKSEFIWFGSRASRAKIPSNLDCTHVHDAPPANYKPSRISIIIVYAGLIDLWNNYRQRRCCA